MKALELKHKRRERRKYAIRKKLQALAKYQD